jgi:hypothetical protein
MCSKDIIVRSLIIYHVTEKITYFSAVSSFVIWNAQNISYFEAIFALLFFTILKNENKLNCFFCTAMPMLLPTK